MNLKSEINAANKASSDHAAETRPQSPRTAARRGCERYLQK